MLTGIALKDFIEYHYNQVDFTKESHELNYELFLANTEDIHQLASIIEWLDSVGIIVYTIPVYHFGGLSFKSIIDGYDLNMEEFYFFKNRQQATEQAIIKANKIYNEE